MFTFLKSSDYIDIGGVQVDIQNVVLKKSCYNEKTGFPFGTAFAKSLSFDMNSSEVVEGVTFEYHAVTIDENDDGTDYNIGTFIAVRVEANDTTGIAKVLAYDLMVNANIPYVSALTYPDTLTDVLNEICTLTGLTLDENASLINGTFSVDANYFTENQTCREVIAAIAEVNGAFAQIEYLEDYGDRLVFVTPDMDADALAEAQPEHYASLSYQQQTDAINTVTIRDTLTGDTETLGSGENTILYIDDNPFCSTEANREALITGIYNTVSGISYYPFIAKGLGNPNLNCGDAVMVFDKNANEYDSFMFSMEYRSVGDIKSKNSVMSAPAVAKTPTPIQYVETPEMQKARKAYALGLTAQASADGKNTIYYQAAEPTGGTYKENDTWFDTDAGNKIYKYNSGAWVEAKFGTEAFAVGAITAASGIIASLDAAVITTGSMSANRITGGVLTAVEISGIFGSFLQLVAGVAGAQRIEQGYDINYDPYFKMYDNSNNLVIQINKSGLFFGSDTKMVRQTIDGVNYLNVYM